MLIVEKLLCGLILKPGIFYTKFKIHLAYVDRQIDFHWLLVHFRKASEALLIGEHSMISQALQADVIICTQPPTPHPVSAPNLQHPITIQDGGIKNLVYLVLCSKIMPALQANDTQIKVIGSMKPEMCTKMLRNQREKLRARFPETKHGYSMVKIAHLDDSFSEFFEVEASPVEGQSLQQKNKKKS